MVGTESVRYGGAKLSNSIRSMYAISFIYVKEKGVRVSFLELIVV